MGRRRSMGGAGGLAAPKPLSGGGFTLVEILTVLALIGLISALLLGSGDALLRAMAKDDIETVTLNAVAAARHSAVLTGRQLELHYDEKARQLDWTEGRTVLTGAGDLRLLPPVRISSMIIGGREVEEAITRVRFYADGTCDPFRLEFVGEQTSRILVIDPWTCTVLSPKTAGHH